ncbi:MAG TPA: sugar phosphate isomerase/epimerase family protein [Puia sp.]|nr:sugar phosphate isomerase/epimerase family protein [Puia sp.]
MPELAAFPKAFMQALCKDGTMKISEWIELASKLDIDGLEWYAGFLEMSDEKNWPVFRRMVEDRDLKIPMMCCSPDFTHPDKSIRNKEIAKEKRWIDMTCALGAGYCRILSGQRRPGLTIEEGLRITIESIQECLSYAQDRGIILILENHYKDDFWEYPEFAQKMNVFCQLVDSIQHPNFGVNFDPSNAYLAGEDPLVLLKRVSDRVVTMHASDRYLLEGTIEDLRRDETGTTGYAKRLKHGEIGRGLNDYDAIFTELIRVHFNGWISIEDGIEGMEQLERSVFFLRNKIQQYWTDYPSFTNQ